MQTTQEKANKYDFPVALVPIFTMEGSRPELIAGRKGVQRTDNSAVLGIVSDKYKILPHADVVEAFRSAIGEECQERITVTKGGARLFITYTLPAEKFEVTKGDFINLKLVAINSYDGSHRLQVTFGGERLVCSNGMIGFRSLVNLEERHVGSIGIKAESLAIQISMFVEEFHKTMPVMKEMVTAGLDPVGLQDRLFGEEAVAKLPTYLLAAAREEFVRAGELTQWGAYNAYTYAISHKMRKESPEAQMRYGRIAWEATQALV